MKIPIPDDWSDPNDWCLLIACIPNSTQWKATYAGAFYQLTYWTAWDKDTGSINGAKAIANEVYKGVCMATCADIVDALNGIKDALAGDQITTFGVEGITTALDDIKQHLDQLEEILNNQSEIFGADVVTVAPPPGP